MNKSIFTFIVFSAFPVMTSAQIDPLSPSYMPTIDTNPAVYPSTIWITDTMQKVRKDSGLPGAQHWGTFYGTQNEFVDFQVHFQNTDSGASNLSMTAGNFVQSSPSSYTISASSRNIMVYREAYMNVRPQVTATANTYYNSLGYYPDILIPMVGSTNSGLTSVSSGTPSKTSVLFTFVGTPAAVTYQFDYDCGP